VKNRNSICLVIVLYQQKLCETRTYQSLISQYDFDGEQLGLFIWDNSSEASAPSELTSAAYYIHSDNNVGLSKAYNTAALYAQEHGFTWLLLLDQDTFFPPRIIEEYQKAIDENPSINLFSLKTKAGNGKYMSPCIMRHKIARLSDNAPTGSIDLSNYSLINSGLLVNIGAFNSIGGYNEMVYLDFSDHDFIGRFKRIHKEAFIIDKTSCQSFSSTEETDKEKLMARYKILCQCVKNCGKETVWENIDYLFMVFKRAVSLSIKAKSISFMILFFQEYVFKRGECVVNNVLG